jgi:recombination protein RecT
VAVTKDGGSMIRVMSVAEINKRRGVSRAKDGPMWRDWWDEAAMKTVLRNLAKRLPASSDLDDLVRRDDDEEAFAPGVQSGSDTNLPCDEGSDARIEHNDPDDGVSERPAAPTENAPQNEDVESAFASGMAARQAGHKRQAVPGEYRTPETAHLAKAWWNGYDQARDEADQRTNEGA